MTDREKLNYYGFVFVCSAMLLGFVSLLGYKVVTQELVENVATKATVVKMVRDSGKTKNYLIEFEYGSKKLTNFITLSINYDVKAGDHIDVYYLVEKDEVYPASDFSVKNYAFYLIAIIAMAVSLFFAFKFPDKFVKYIKGNTPYQS